MNIRKINSATFGGKIIDSHMHYGTWKHGQHFPIEFLDKFTKTPLTVNIAGQESTDTIEKILVSSMDNILDNGNLADEVKGLKDIQAAAKHNDKVAILAVCQPNKTKGNINELKKAIEQNPEAIVGFKFHPTDLNKTIEGKEVSINPDWYKPYMKFAKEKKFPCLFHSDSGLSNPAEIYNLAKKHPQVPVILGHCGGADFTKAKEAIISSIEKQDAKLYCDISWLNWGEPIADLPPDNPKNFIDLIKSLKEKNGIDRILFGTDAPLGCFGEKTVREISEQKAYSDTVSKLKTAIKNNFETNEANEIIDKIFYQNAHELFFNKDFSHTNIVKSKSKGKYIVLALLGIAAATSAFWAVKNHFFSNITKGTKQTPIVNNTKSNIFANVTNKKS